MQTETRSTETRTSLQPSRDKRGIESWKDEFIDALKASGSVLRACTILDIGRSTIYRHMESDPAFAERIREQRERVFDKVEDALVQRAIDHDTTAAIFLLKSNRRAVYAERLEVTGAGGGPVELRAVSAADQRVEIAKLVDEAHR